MGMYNNAVMFGAANMVLRNSYNRRIREQQQKEQDDIEYIEDVLIVASVLTIVVLISGSVIKRIFKVI